MTLYIERRGPVADPKVPKGVSRRDLPVAALRADLALGVCRRHAPKRCSKNRSAASTTDAIPSKHQLCSLRLSALRSMPTATAARRCLI